MAALALDYGVIVAAAAAATWIGWFPVTLLALVVIAGRQSALQGLVHSACHYSLFPGRRANDAFELLYAYPILDAVAIYREQHLEHHRDFTLRTPDRFDYLLKTLELSREGFLARTWVVFVRPLLGHAGWIFLTDVVSTYAEHPRAARRLVAFWSLVLACAWAAGALELLVVYWIVPLVWLYPVFDLWAELSDHLDARYESRNQDGLFYSLLLKGHETYHAVHHLYPSVPFYRLADLHERLRQRGVVMERSRGPLDFLRIAYGVPGRRAPARVRGVGA